MTDVVLFGNRESGHSYKVAMFLALAQVPHRFVSVDLAQPREERVDEFRHASKFGEVPTLLLDGEPHCQSNAILMRLAEVFDRFGGAPQGVSQRVREWLGWEANRIGLSVPNIRFALRFQTDTHPEVIAWLRHRALSDLGRLNQELSDGRKFILGREPTIADLSLSGYLFWPDQVQLDLSYWPDVQRWLENIRALPYWQQPYDLMVER